MYPPEVLIPKYIKIDPIASGSAGFVDTRLDLHRSLLVLGSRFGTDIKEYDLDLNLKREVHSASWNDYSESIYPKLPDFYPAQDVHRSDDYWGTLGPIEYAYFPEKLEWRLGAHMTDLPLSQRPTDPNSGILGVRSIVSHHALASFKDLAVHLDGQVLVQKAATYTGDNLFGAPEKHAMTMPFFSGTWTLLVRGEPVLRQKVRNLCLGAYDLSYSPVYGLVRFDYQASVGGGNNAKTVYILKVRASGPDVYKDIRGREDAELVVD